MAKQITHAKINTPTARARLGARKAPYWMPITRGCTLGYRRTAEGGRWLAKYVGDSVRKETTLGPSDDALEADGAIILSFAQAQKVARTWFAEQARKATGLPIHDGPYTVADAMRDYLNEMERKGKKSAKDHRMRAEALILPALGQVEISKLTAKRIRDWLHAVAQTPARLRTRPGQEQQYREASDDPEALRKRQSSSNRTLTILKAALNFAFREEHVESDTAWRRVEPYENVDAARVRWLTNDEAVRLINVCPEDFCSLVSAALVSGARYGELAAMKVADFDPDNGSVFIAESKSGKARHAMLTEEGTNLFSSRTLGRAADELIFLKSDGGPWRRSNQAWPLRAACKAARLKPAVTFHELRHTYASLSLMAGMDLTVLADNLGHADTRMVSRHYGHIADEYRKNEIRAKAPRFGLNIKSNVTAIKAPKSS
jgi:integrase